MKLCTRVRHGMRTPLDLAVHQGEEPVLLAEKDYELGIRTTKAL
jgi:hypothetical protein